MTDEYQQASDDAALRRYRKGLDITSQSVPREPSSAELVRRIVSAALDVARESGVDNPHEAVLGMLGCRLAIAAENNNWVREWLAEQAEEIRVKCK